MRSNRMEHIMSTTVGQQVKWAMLDGTVMVGTVLDNRPTFMSAYVERIDGTRCYVGHEKLSRADWIDIENAAKFFANIGN